MKSVTPKKVEIVMVKVKVRAIEQGYYGGQIVPIGAEFTYEGGLNRAGGLPLWVEALEDFKLPKKAEAKVEEKKEEVKAPAPALPVLASAEAPKKGGKKSAKVSLSDSVV